MSVARERDQKRDKRRPMLNLNWGGVETNQIGTAEFVDFCRRVNTEPLMCVNFEAEGYAPSAKTAAGDVRAGDAREAAEWVDYCNNPDNKERIGHGFREPLPIKVWQLGNETSYSNERFNRATAIAKTIEFATAMRKMDPSIKLVFVTVTEDPDIAAEAFRAGASAYLLKRSAASELLVAIREVMKGRSYVTPLVTEGMVGSLMNAGERKPSHELTPRQREVLQLLAEGHSMKQVGALLNVTPRTVAFHKYRMMEQLKVKSTAELIQYAVKHHIG